jgi:hypothetical protein
MSNVQAKVQVLDGKRTVGDIDIVMGDLDENNVYNVVCWEVAHKLYIEGKK